MLFFLIGFMGSGKSHWGKLWAAEYKLGFVDMDEEIEILERKKVSEIFDSKGEEYFRSIEMDVLRSYEKLGSTIIACGGGTPCFYNNMKWMNEHGITTYLSAGPQEILRRLMKAQQQNQRPLISKLNQAELLFFIEKKMKEREPFYNQANIILDSSSITEHTFEEKILPY
jgi:shikimate kinase